MISIQKLIDLYMETISSDHHKERDRHFSVSINYVAREDSPLYYASHEGYMHEFYEEYPSFQEAEEGLREQVKNIISDQLEYSTKVNANPEEYDSYVLPQSRIEEIRKEVFGE